MKPFSLMLLLCSACVADADVENALANYCIEGVGISCSKTGDCCPTAPFACVAGSCERIIVGTCLFAPDAGQQQALGEGCGCTSDCAAGTCSTSKCQ